MFFPETRTVVEVRLIRRRKLLGPGLHWGILVRYRHPWPHHMGAYLYPQYTEVVYDLNDQGFAAVSFSEFTQGRPIETRAVETSPQRISAILARIRHLEVHPVSYDLMARNCEHIANFLFSGRAESGQVQALSLVGLIAVGYFFLRGTA